MSAHQKVFEFSTAGVQQEGQALFSFSSSSQLETDVLQIIHLLRAGQEWCESLEGGLLQLCQEVKLILQKRGELLLGRPDMIGRVDLPYPVSLTFPVQFNKRTYGVLYIACDPLDASQPALALAVALLLAQVCSWLLYTLEQSLFLKKQCQYQGYRLPVSFTKRERAILTLMSQGYDQQTIADMLHVTLATVNKHRQHIYDRLGVHKESDAILAAYHLGFFSLLPEEKSQVLTRKHP